jgi:hypothetical protein
LSFIGEKNKKITINLRKVHIIYEESKRHTEIFIFVNIQCHFYIKEIKKKQNVLFINFMDDYNIPEKRERDSNS